MDGEKKGTGARHSPRVLELWACDIQVDMYHTLAFLGARMSPLAVLGLLSLPADRLWLLFVSIVSEG
jgi:hypothetical protein